jgi:ribonuclease P protein component
VPRVSPSELSTARAVGRVHGRRSFAALRAEGTRRRSGPITVTFVADPDGDVARVAYAVNRSVGTAVRRNRLRRRLRAIAHELELVPGTYLVAAAPPAAVMPHPELTGHVRAAVAR